MYTISYYREEIGIIEIYHPSIPELQLLSAQFSNALNTIGTLTLKIPQGHCQYDIFQVLKGIIILYKDKKIIWKGRIYSITVDENLIETVECEGILGILNDTIVKPYSYSMSGQQIDGMNYVNFDYNLRNFLFQLSNNHNMQSNAQLHFFNYIIDDDIKDMGFYCSNSNYSNTWTELYNQICNTTGLIMYMEYSEDVTSTENDILHITSQYTKKCNQKIKWSENIKTIKKKIEADNFATAILPLGANIDNNKVKITSVNNNSEYLVNEDKAREYGRINTVVEFSTITQATDLLILARKKLAEMSVMTMSIEVTAVDLSYIDNNTDYFDVGSEVKIESKHHNISEKAIIKEINIDITRPHTAVYTIGVSRLSYIQGRL